MTCGRDQASEVSVFSSLSASMDFWCTICICMAMHVHMNVIMLGQIEYPLQSTLQQALWSRRASSCSTEHVA